MICCTLHFVCCEPKEETNDMRRLKDNENENIVIIEMVLKDKSIHP